mmetsp:Transcript_26498/g.70953  ORF Transcript_26498/g.70953 Transcript_26498/m.70953 type:complete len:270 (+) Transcript_26498:266-1075(+)
MSMTRPGHTSSTYSSMIWATMISATTTRMATYGLRPWMSWRRAASRWRGTTRSSHAHRLARPCSRRSTRFTRGCSMGRSSITSRGASPSHTPSCPSISRSSVTRAILWASGTLATTTMLPSPPAVGSTPSLACSTVRSSTRRTLTPCSARCRARCSTTGPRTTIRPSPRSRRKGATLTCTRTMRRRRVTLECTTRSSSATAQSRSFASTTCASRSSCTWRSTRSTRRYRHLTRRTACTPRSRTLFTPSARGSPRRCGWWTTRWPTSCRR